MKELIKDNIERTEKLMAIFSKFDSRIANAYIDLLKDLSEYGEDPKNKELYNTIGYTWIVEPEIEALCGTEKTIKKLLKDFYTNKS